MRNLSAASVIVLAAFTLVGCSASTKTVAGPTVVRTQLATTTDSVTATATMTATRTLRPTVVKVVATRTHTMTVTYTPPPPHQYGDGTYLVGSDIEPGLYQTSGGDICYWARLSSLNSSDIIDNGNPQGQATIEVQSGDRALEITGDCTFGRRRS